MHVMPLRIHKKHRFISSEVQHEIFYIMPILIIAHQIHHNAIIMIRYVSYNSCGCVNDSGTTND